MKNYTSAVDKLQFKGLASLGSEHYVPLKTVFIKPIHNAVAFILRGVSMVAEIIIDVVQEDALTAVQS